MRIFTFSCAHIARPATLVGLDMLWDINFENMRRFIKLVKREKPDAVINLGDLHEPFYEDGTEYLRIVPEYAELVAPDAAWQLYEIAGNHDPGEFKALWAEVDNIRFEHGNKLTVITTRDFFGHHDYIQLVRTNYNNKKVVHGHTHVPYQGSQGWPLDVGSLTKDGTWGEILDGFPILRRLS
jgi:predicted phosphodiesterase